MKLTVRVARWRCHNPGCERQIFCQRLDGVAGQHARETKRFGEILQLLGHAMGGRPGDRLSAPLGLSVSDDTLLRRVKRCEAMGQVTSCNPAHYGVGVDDRAWRKGHGHYGAILVDLKRREVADPLPECSAIGLQQWLRQHPGVKFISRDRRGSLAEGGRRGAPTARQVTDRFHLIQNLQQAVQTELVCRRAYLKIPAEQFTRQAETDQAPKTV